MIAAISLITTSFFFSRNSLDGFYGNAHMALSEFSDSITMFFDAKETELNIFSESDAVKSADESIHSFVNESGDVRIVSYEKSSVEQDIRDLAKNFAKHDSNIAEIYVGTKWGGYATNFDGAMSGGYDPRKRPWYESALSGNGKIVLTEAFASTVGTTVVGVTRSVYDSHNIFIGNASIEVSLNTLTKILDSIDLGEGSFLMMVEKNGTILADTGNGDNNFKNVSEIGIPALVSFLDGGVDKSRLNIDGTRYLTVKVTNQKTGYDILALCPMKTVYGAFYKTILFTLGICALLTILVAGLTVFFAKRLTDPLKVIRDNISESAEQIADGKADLTQRIQVKARTEVGDVATSFNVFSEKLREIIKSMKKSKNQLSEAGDKLSGSTSDTMAAITQIISNIESLGVNLLAQNGSVNHTSETIGEMLKSITSLEMLLSDQAGSVQTASSTVEEMIGNISEVNRSVDKMASSFGTLAEDAEDGAKTQEELQLKIGEIENQSLLLSDANTVIASIAEQTNLLAMNAAIEAAHAGEAGKGFAVVADEIRKLSETSSSQSKTIGDQLKHIQEAIETVVAATQRGVQGYAHLADEIQETDTLVQQIKAAMAEQKEGSTMITNALHEMNDSTYQVQSAAQKMTKESNRIIHEIGKLNDETESMRGDMEQMNISAEKIKETGSTLLEVSTALEKSINRIGRQVDQFEV